MANSRIGDVLARIDDIKKWKAAGATDEQICQALGISKTSLYTYKKQNSEILNALKRGCSELVLDLRGELARQAKPHTTTTKKKYIRTENGHEVQYVEEIIQEHDGNVAAAHLLLKNLDRRRWKENWDTYEFKKMELKLQKLALDKKLEKDW